MVVLGLIHELHGVTEIGLECVGDDGFPWSLILLGIDGVMASLSAGVDQLRKLNNESNHCYIFQKCLINLLVVVDSRNLPLKFGKIGLV